MKHGKKAKPPGPITDPNNTQAVRHKCGHVRIYTDLPKFNLPAVAIEVMARQKRECRGCRNIRKSQQQRNDLELQISKDAKKRGLI